MPLRWVVALALAVCALFGASPARAWQEAHETADDVHVVVDASGVAAVEHVVAWRVVHGPLSWIDLSNVDPATVLESDVAIAGEDGRPVSAGHLARREGGAVRVTIDEPRSLMRGVFRFDVRWRIDLAATHALARDGAAWRVTLTSPIASDGFDVARTVIDVPAAPEPPRAIDPESGQPDEAALAVLHRGPLVDSLELLHPHMARGQSVTWTVRADPRAFFPSAIPPPSAATPAAASEPDRIRAVLRGLLLLGIAAVFAVLVLAKRRAVSLRSDACGARARALLPLPATALAWLGGAAIAIAVGLQMAGEAAIAGVFVGAAVLAATSLPSVMPARARPAGRWLLLRPVDAFAAPGSFQDGPEAPVPPAPALPADRFDVGTLRGGLAALAALMALVMTAWVLRAADVADAPWLVAIDGAALLPLFVTGRAGQVGGPRGEVTARWMARALEGLRRVGRLKASPWARLATDGSVEELRLLVLPFAPAPGVVGIELGLAWNATPVGWAPSPEVLVRVLEGSAAAAIVGREAPHVRPAIGRRREERVLRFTPSSPTRRSAIELARTLAAALTDRRAQPAKVAWAGRERRVARVAAPRRPETARPHQQAC
jgi:hypothetical protein